MLIKAQQKRLENLVRAAMEDPQVRSNPRYVKMIREVKKKMEDLYKKIRSKRDDGNER